MSTLFIQDTTLTAIADAIRTKSGSSEIVPIVEIFKSDNVNTVEDYTPGAPTGTFYQVVKIEGASELLVKLWLELNNTAASNFMMKSGEHEQGSWNYSSADYQRSGASGTVTYEMFSFKDTDAVSLYAYNAGTNANSFGWYVEVEGYDADGNVIGEGSGTPLTYKPGEMPAAILAISGEGGGGITPEGEIEIIENGDFDVTTYASAHVAVPVGIFPTGEKQITVNGNYDITNFATVSVEVPTGGSDDVEDVILTGNCAYAGAGAIASAYIKMYGNKIITQGISDASNMFFSSTVESIPFTLRFVTSSYVSMGNMFQNCINLKTLPTIFGTVQPNVVGSIFMNCQKLRNIPEDYFDNWNFTRVQTYAYAQFGSMFQNCHSLRNIPTKLLENMYGIQTTSTYLPYFNAFNKCYVLDEIVGLGVLTSTLTSNAFANNPFGDCHRLKRLTFATNSDGTPKTANWKNQTIDLSGANNFNTVGYTTVYTNITSYNSGITQDKEVKDDATYQTLKNDPDWWTEKWGYSRYNKTSAIETINSLPDVSTSGGTNTIKFKGAAGSKTDGGAINTMTEAEIAVAAAKGWTVTFI